jgi:hypothetical protein
VLTKELDIGAGRFVNVAERDYPALMEWDWSFDETTEQPFRIDPDTGRGVPLVYDLLRLYVQRNEEEGAIPLLPRRSVRAIFDTTNNFHEFYRIARQQRKVAEAVGFIPPNPLALLGLSLSAALIRYIEWRQRGKRFAYVIDKGMTALEGATLPRYETLGAWMDAEYTGRLVEGEPERYRSLVIGDVGTAFRRLAAERNPGADPRQVYMAFNETVPNRAVLGTMIDALAEYPLP